MTKRVEQAMCLAIRQGKSWRAGNTEVRQLPERRTEVYLFGNLIAVFSDQENPKWTLAGWNTTTTQSRINAMAMEFTWPYRVRTIHGTPMLIPLNRKIGEKDWIDALSGKPLKLKEKEGKNV